MHALRCAALLDAVRALIAGRRLTLMELARSWPDALRVAAPLKRLDRLLGNGHLAEERDGLYAALINWAVRQPRPVIVVDWSPLDRRGRFQLLRADWLSEAHADGVREGISGEVGGQPLRRAPLLYALKQAIPMGCIRFW
jgi:hypothetical protein